MITMDSAVIAFFIMLLANAVTVALYLVHGLIVRPIMRSVGSKRSALERQRLLRRFRATSDAIRERATASSPSAEISETSALSEGATSSAPVGQSARADVEEPSGAGTFQTRVLEEEISDDASVDREGKRADPEDAAREEEGYSREQYLMHAAVMLLLPVAGACYFGFGYLFRRAFFRKNVDVSDVIFSKQRTVADERADMNREVNIAPMGEAVAVSDEQGLRRLILDVMRGGSRVSMKSISLALQSDDSEASHYAASILSDSLNRFRMEARVQLNRIHEDERGSEHLVAEVIAQNENASQEELDQARVMLLAQECGEFIAKVDSVLRQGVLTSLEQREWTASMADVADVMWRNCREEIDAEQIDSVCSRLIDAGDFVQAQQWCRRARKLFPSSLIGYTVSLHLSYAMGDGAGFSRTLQELKESSIVIDRRTLDLIRLYSTPVIA
jgi:hypothetical protein